MSRTNPYKRKPRRPNKTVLLVCEGPTEKAFCDYLKSLYLVRDGGISVTIRSADGELFSKVVYDRM